MNVKDIIYPIHSLKRIRIIEIHKQICCIAHKIFVFYCSA